MKEMKTLKFPNQDEPYEVVDGYAREQLDVVLNDAKKYTDTEIAALVNSAPETLNTLGELAAAFEENEEVVDVLNQAITTRVQTINGVGVDAEGNIEVRELPEVTEADNSKLLVVINGSWTATSIAIAEELSF